MVSDVRHSSSLLNLRFLRFALSYVASDSYKDTQRKWEIQMIV